MLSGASAMQARCQGRAFRGRAFPNDCSCPPEQKLCPPKPGLCPKEMNRLGAPGVQMEAKNSQISVYHRNFCGLTPGFLLLLGRRPFFLSSPKNSRKIEKILRRPFFCSSPFSFDPHSNKLLVPPWPVRIHINKLLVPPKIYFCLPVTLSWRRAWRNVVELRGVPG